MNDELIKRIGDNYLPANHKDGDTFLHTDYNEFLSIFKTAINENYFDIQKIINGSIKVSDSSKLNGASLSQYVNGSLSSDDNTVPSSKQVKEYVDGQYGDLQSKNDALAETVSNNTESIKVFNDSVTELKDSKANVSETGNSIEILLNNENYIITVRLLDITGKELSTSNIDLPLESVVVGAEYIDGTKTIRLSLKNGEYIDVPVSSLVSGLVSDETFNKKVGELQDQIDNKISSIPLATENIIGGVKPVSKTEDMITPVGIDADGKLYTSDIGSATPGENGATFTPSVSADGIISFTNDKGLENPDPVDIKGPQGPQGVPGQDGEQGPQGVPGNDGVTPNIQVGTVTTLDPTQQATVTRTGTNENPIFNFGIPKGEKGESNSSENYELFNAVPTFRDSSSVIGGERDLVSFYDSLDFPVIESYIKTFVNSWGLGDINLENQLDLSKFIIKDGVDIYNIDSNNLIPNYVKPYKDLSTSNGFSVNKSYDEGITIDGYTKNVDITIYDSAVDDEIVYLPGGNYYFEQDLNYRYGVCHIICESLSSKEQKDIYQESVSALEFSLNEMYILKKVYISFKETGSAITDNYSTFTPVLFYDYSPNKFFGIKKHNSTLKSTINLSDNMLIPRNELFIYSGTGEVKMRTNCGYMEFPVSDLEYFEDNRTFGWKDTGNLCDDLDIENSIYANSELVSLNSVASYYCSNIELSSTTLPILYIKPGNGYLHISSDLSLEEFKNTYRDLVVKIIYAKNKNIELKTIGIDKELANNLRTRIGYNCFVVIPKDENVDENSYSCNFKYAIDTHEELNQNNSEIYSIIDQRIGEIRNQLNMVMDVLDTSIGYPEDLQTESKVIVDAINELKGEIDSLKNSKV